MENFIFCVVRRKLSVHKIFRRRLLNVLCTFNKHSRSTSIPYFVDDPAKTFNEKYKKMSAKEKKKYDKAFLNEGKYILSGSSNNF